MTETSQISELQLSNATHLLIRQMPPSGSDLEIGEIGQPIPILLQVTESQDKSNDGPEDKSQPAHTVAVVSEKPPVTTPSLLEVSSLEDFMDVVTTYKCKFCPFSCGWKSGLMSHIRNTHFEVAAQKAASLSAASNSSTNSNVVSLSGNNQTVQTQQLMENTLNDSSSTVAVSVGAENVEKSNPLPEACDEVIGQAQEKQIFLCGQCNQGFTNLEQCKAHMIQDHQVKVDQEENDIQKKRRKHRPKKRLHMPDTSSYGVHVESNENDGFETSSKRRVRPPRALEEDYVLGRRKRRARLENSDDRNYRCNERGCGYRFRTENSLRYHEQCHIRNQRTFICLECNEKSENWRMLSMHLWKVHQIDTDLHICSDCDYRTYSLFKLENHQRIHSEERSFVCNTCGKGFKQISQLRNHCVIHMDRKNMSEKRWYSEQECEICHRTFSDSKCLRKHLQAVHNKIKPFVCSYCGHTSARKAMLQLHMRQHTGEKPFVCDQCDYRTGDHNSLRRHKMRHTGTKPYKCPHCSYACIQAISYKTHLKNKHPGMEGLFCCNLCSFRSVSKDNYMNHMADHKRGAIATVNVAAAAAATATEEQPPAAETTLSQLEGVLPGNLAAAQLIYSCLNALSQEGGQALPTGVTATASNDGTQTITIQIPSNQELPDAEQYYLTIQQPQELVEAHLEDNEQGDHAEYTVATTTAVDTIHLTSENVSSAEELSTVQLVATEQDLAKVIDDGNQVSIPLVITQAEN